MFFIHLIDSHSILAGGGLEDVPVGNPTSVYQGGGDSNNDNGGVLVKGSRGEACPALTIVQDVFAFEKVVAEVARLQTRTRIWAGLASEFLRIRLQMLPRSNSGSGW